MTADFDRTVGYADFGHVDRDALRSKVGLISSIVRPHWSDGGPRRCLVAGCGEGSEALFLAEALRVPTIGVDITLTTSAVSADGLVQLHPGDLTHLSFDDGSFDFIYSYHVLEHVSDPDAVLSELRRVLSDDGLIFIGFPNKHRAVAYVGTHTGESLANKIRWNLNDYRDRMLGRFENELGAHAGFAQRPFMARCRPLFDDVIPIRDQYMLGRYPQFSPLVRLLARTGLGEIAFPSNYFILKNSRAKG